MTRPDRDLYPGCDGVHCESPHGETRRFLEWRFCRACFDAENARRRERERITHNSHAFPVLDWEEARR